nr:hypothetical protein [Tanacetum cinerariifolium]
MNNIELEYNLEPCYLALTDQIDWANPEGGKCPYDLSKPLPLQGPPGHKTIHVDFFFNKDLKYLKTGNKEKKYVVLLTKLKAARDPNVNSSTEQDIRAYQKEYIFNEADFSRLHLNDIEYIIVIKKRVQDVQLGMESYQAKLNITVPQSTCDGLKFKEPYTMVYKPRGVVYQNKSNQKILMRADELYKFSDGTLKVVQTLFLQPHSSKVGFIDTCSSSSFQSQSFSNKIVNTKLPHHQRASKSNKE